MKYAFQKQIKKMDHRDIFKSFLPTGLFRLRNLIRYRRQFPNAVVTSDSIIASFARIGRNVTILKSLVGETVSVGNFTTINQDCTINGKGKIDIGKFCGIGPECFIWSENHNYNYFTIYSLEQFQKGVSDKRNEYLPGNIKIGNDVWMGRRSIVLAGAEIGDGCIIGAGSVLPAKKYPPYTIIAGSPGKVVKDRFAPNIKERLSKLRWWDLDEEIIFDCLIKNLSFEINI